MILFLADNYSLRDPYDKIIRCLGFKVRIPATMHSLHTALFLSLVFTRLFGLTFQSDFSIFNDSVMPEKGLGKKSKYPLITPDYQSQNIPRLWFGKEIGNDFNYILPLVCIHDMPLSNSLY